MGLREEFFDLIVKNWTESEQGVIYDYVKNVKGRDEFLEEDLPLCFGFHLSSDKECEVCILSRLCQIGSRGILLKYIKAVMAEDPIFEKQLWINLLGIENFGDYKIRLNERFLLQSVERLGEVVVGVEDISDNGIESSTDQELDNDNIDKEDKKVMPKTLSDTIEKGEVERMGFRKNSKVGLAVSLLLEGKTEEEVAEVISPDNVEYGLKYLKASVYYLLKKKGYKVDKSEGRVKIIPIS